MGQVKVSVIIPVYNVERYLARCLDSVIAAVSQLSTLNPQHSTEIICVNDGSTDGSAKILEHYRSTFDLEPSTFSVLTKPNGGQGSARNVGLDVATGDYLMFVDSDDYIPVESIASFVRVAEVSKSGLVVSTSFLIDRKGLPDLGASKIVGDYRMRARDWVCGRKIQYSVCNKLYARTLWGARRFPKTVFEDYPTITGVFCDIASFAAIDVPLYVYCIDREQGSTVRSPFGMRKTADSFAVIRQVLAYAKGRDCWKFALRQAADGLSSTIGKVYKSRDGDAITTLIAQCDHLKRECYDVFAAMSIKAKIRLFILNRNRWSYVTDKLNGVKLPPIGKIEKAVAADIGADSVVLEVNPKQGFSARTYVGRTSDGQGLFVKLGEDISRSFPAHAACADLPFVPKIISHEGLCIEGHKAFVMSLLGGRNFEHFENMSVAQLESFVRGYCEFSLRIQKLRAVTSEIRLYGEPDEDYHVIESYAQRFPRYRLALAPLLSIPVDDRTFLGHEKLVIHNDFTRLNHAFDKKGLSAIYDLDSLGLGHPAEELFMELGIRYREASLGWHGRRTLRKYFMMMVSLSGFSFAEWRMVVNMQRLRWAALFVRSRPDGHDYIPKIVRRDKRSCELLAVLEKMEKSA